MLVNPFESEQQGGSVKEAESLCVCRSVCVCCLEMVDSGGGRVVGQRKQDANEPALINVCLISYSALSGHGKDRGGEQRER